MIRRTFLYLSFFIAFSIITQTAYTQTFAGNALIFQIATLSSQITREADPTEVDITTLDETQNRFIEKIREQEKELKELRKKVDALTKALTRRIEEEIRKEERERQQAGLSNRLGVGGTYVERPEEWMEKTGIAEQDARKLSDARLIELTESLKLPRALKHPALSRTTRKIFDRMIQDRIDLLTEEQLEPFGTTFFEQGDNIIGSINQTGVPPDYQLGPGDSLRIVFWSDIGEESKYTVTVDHEGQVFIPTLGVFGVQGMTFSEFEKTVLSNLSSKYKASKGQITLVRVRNIQVFVTGEAVRPGAQIVSALSTAFNVLYKAGGPSKKGTMRDVRVIRGNKVIRNIDLYKYLINGDKSQDIQVENGDTILIPTVGKQVSVKGQVIRPAIYELASEKTLGEVLEMAGGVKPSAYTKRIKIFRWQGDQRRQMLDISQTDEKSLAFELENGDEIIVDRGIEEIGNFAKIEGAVMKPGKYSVDENTRVSDLIEKAGGLIPEEVSKHAGQIIRRIEGRKEQLISFDPEMALTKDPNHDPTLRPFDSVKIFSEKEVKPDDRFVNIIGAIRRPGEYIFRDGMTIRDLILRAQGLTIEASGEAEVARIIRGQEASIQRVNVSEVLKNPHHKDNIRLLPMDKVTVLAQGDKRLDPEIVIIRGEVKRPGPYALKYPGEPISSLIERAGGLTSQAFPEGTIFKRLTNQILDEEHLKFVQVVQDDLYKQAALALRTDLIRSGANPAALDVIEKAQPEKATATWRFVEEDIEGEEDVLEESEEYVTLKTARSKAAKTKGYSTYIPSRNIIQETTRIPIRLEAILRKEKNVDDIPLCHGDQIFIPRIPTTISVIGAVVNPSSVLFKENANVKYYIDRVGGFAEHSAHSRTVILRANGEVLPLKHIKKIQRGDIILVPPRPKLIRKKRLQDSLQESLQIAQVLANLAVSYKVLVKDD